MKHVVLPILFVGVMPYALTGLSKSKGFSTQDNQETRKWQAGLSGWRQRAFWAHQNAFEALPLFAALTLCAYVAQPASVVAAAAAWTFVALRIAYSACYLGDLGRARSTVWMLSQGALLALVLVALSIV